MNKLTTSTVLPTRELKLEAIANMSASFELLCLASGMEALGEMMASLHLFPEEPSAIQVRGHMAVRYIPPMPTISV